MKCDGSIHSLIQGISQQPQKIRLMGQCTLQENCSSNPVDGLTRRPPTTFIKTLDIPVSGAQWYNFNIDGVHFILCIQPGSISVHDVLGNEYTVNVSSDAEVYLSDGVLSFVLSEKILYIGNANITVQIKSDTKEFDAPAALIHLVGGQYGRDYTATVKWGSNEETFHYQTPNGAAATDAPKVATTYIATELEEDFNDNGTLTGLFSIERVEDVLLIKSTNSASVDFELTVDDGDGGSRMFVTNNTVVDVGSLPRYASHGYYVSITGSGTADVDDYYLQFQVTEGSSIGQGFGKQGIWVETVQWNIPYLLDTTTMPVLMEYDKDTGIFSIDTGDWKGRQVGDETTNENPSFIDNKVQSLSSFQGRLVMFSGENRLMSRTNKPLDFWRESATVLTDSDSIDDSSTTKSATLRFGVPFNRDLIIFADDAQFVTFGRAGLTPNNSSLVLTTEFEINAAVQPVAAGKNIFYATQYGSFTGIREFFNDVNVDANDARPITQHILKYIEGQAVQLISSTSFDLLFVRTDADVNTLYAYEYIWVDSAKKQASWSKWIFRNPIRYTFFKDELVYIISEYNGEYLLECMNLGLQNEDDLTYPVMLDGKVQINAVDTQFSNPLETTDDILFIQSYGCPYPGLEAEVDTIHSGVVTLKEDMGGGRLVGGHIYNSRYKPTLPYIKDQDGLAIGTGHLIISKFLINYIKTGYFSYTVSSKYTNGFGDTFLGFTDYFSGRILNDPDNIIGQPSLVSGQYVAPFREPTDTAELEIHSQSHLPFTITDIEWKGQYTKKGRRIPSGKK